MEQSTSHRTRVRRAGLVAWLAALAFGAPVLTQAQRLGDLDGDGRHDVLLRHADGRWYYYPMDGRRSIAGRGTARLTADLAWGFRGFGDLDGDGSDDVLLRHEDGRWYYYPMNGRRPLPGGGEADLPPDPAWRFAGIGDLGGDGNDDVLLRHEDGRWLYHPMDGARVAAGGGPLSRLTTNPDWRLAGVGDVNGDGRDDVLLRHRGNGRWRYYPMDGRRVLPNSGLVDLPADAEWRFAGLGDLNGDGRDDVLLRHADGRWLYQPLDGRRRIAAEAGPADLDPDPAWRFAGIGDLDGDGRDDVLLRHEDGHWLYHPMDGRAVGDGAGRATMTRNRLWSVPVLIDGACGEQVGMCLAGDPRDAEDTGEGYRWRCAGRQGGRAAMCAAPKCPNGAAASDDPLRCARGNAGYMIPGIDRLPLDRVRLTNEQVQRHFAIVEVTLSHAQEVGMTACESYVTASEGCEEHGNRAGAIRHPEGDVDTRTGLTPFTQIVDEARVGIKWRAEQIDAMRDLRVLNVSAAPNQSHLGDADKPHLQIRSAGNNESNRSWFPEYSDRSRDLFHRAIAANKLLFVAGMDRDGSGNYIRDRDSSSCRDVDDGCVWAWFTLPADCEARFACDVGGTSFSAPNVAAALASILSVFPDTSHQDLAKLTRACAKKTGEGIDGPRGLLATSGGFGVADFSCMDEITAASADLAGTETATLAIDGREVTVTRRSITVTEPNPRTEDHAGTSSKQPKENFQ